MGISLRKDGPEYEAAEARRLQRCAEELSRLPRLQAPVSLKPGWEINFSNGIVSDERGIAVGIMVV